MYVPDDYKSYKYVVDYSDNYVVLTNRSSVTADWNTPATIPVIIQYFRPSFLTISDNRVLSQSRQFTEIDVGNSDYSRADFPSTMIAGFVLTFFIIFLINGLTRFVVRGGVFFGD